MEHVAPEPLLAELGEEALDGVQRGRRCWGEMEDEARMSADPFEDLRVLVGGIVVQNDVDQPACRAYVCRSKT
jgi:hypothetical protein